MEDRTPTRTPSPDNPQRAALAAMDRSMGHMLLACAGFVFMLPALGGQYGCLAEPASATRDAGGWQDAESDDVDDDDADAGGAEPPPVRWGAGGDARDDAMHPSTRAVLGGLADAGRAGPDAAELPEGPTWLTPGATAGAAPQGAAGWSGEFALLATGPGLHAVLGVVDATSAGPHGPPRLADRRSHIVHASIADADVPPAADAWRGARVEVVTSLGQRCEARAFAFEYRAELLDPHDELSWNDAGETPGRRGGRLRGGELARTVWRSTSTRMLTARLRPVGHACDGEPLYARLDGSPRTRIAHPTTWVPRRAEVMRAFRTLPAYEAAQAEYVGGGADHAPRSHRDPLRWERHSGAPTVQAFRRADGVVLVSVIVPWASCGAWGPGLWAVYRLRPASRKPPELITSSTETAPASVKLILGADRDDPSFVVEDSAGWGRSVLRGDERLSRLSREYHGCSC